MNKKIITTLLLINFTFEKIIAWNPTTSKTRTTCKLTTTTPTTTLLTTKRFPPVFHKFTTSQHPTIKSTKNKKRIQNDHHNSKLFYIHYPKLYSCIILITLLLFGINGNGNVPNNNNNNNMNNVVHAIMTDDIMSSSSSSSSTTSSSITPSINLDSLQQSLVQPTPEKPQIIIRDNLDGGKSSSYTMSKKNTRIPIVQGIVYLQNNNDRPLLNDYIVITVSSSSSSSSTTNNVQNILAGAKYQVYKAKFPFNFKMYNENILKGKEQEWNILTSNNNNDSSNILIVTAKVCPETSLQLPCTDEDITFIAQGISKLLMIGNLPGGEDGQIIRTPVSLQLKTSTRIK